MKKQLPFTRSSAVRGMRPAFLVTALLALVGLSPAHATQIVRELFDKIGSSDYVTLDGLGSGGSTKGLQGAWSVSPQGLIDGTNVTSTGIVYKDTWSLDWPVSPYQYDGTLLGHNAGKNGLLNFNAGGNLNTLTDPDTSAPYGNWTYKSYATRPLTPGARINFLADGTYYFSVRIEKNYPWWAGDSSAGVGVSTGGGTNDHFVGIGVTRPSPFYLADGTTDIGDASYVSTGTLGQNGITGHESDSGGPYYPRTNGPVGLWVVGDGTYAGLLVGRLTTSISGASTLSVKTYPRNGGPIDLDPSLITWDATYSFNETNTMTHVLVWMHGSNLEYDAVRVGTTYGDVIGFEMIGAPTASPTNTVYAGTTVTVSEDAQLNTGTFPMSFQWLSNGIALPDGTNASLLLTNTTTSFTADYSLIASNYYGIETSAVTHVAFLPATPAFIVQQPGSITRYLGSPAATFSVVAAGTPPYTYQWKHEGTNLGGAVTTTDTTNVLSLPALTLAQGGNYAVNVTNAFGSTNSDPATLSIVVPPTGSYAAALTSLPGLYGYWRLDELATTNNPTIYDYWGNHNGQAVDAANAPNMVFGVPGAPGTGFASSHLATRLGDQYWLGAYRLNLARFAYSNTMTFTMWVYGGCQFVNHNAYANGYGLERLGSGNLQFEWNGATSWDSGLQVPANAWTFVALVVEPTQATIYMGPNPASLISAVSGPLTISDSTTLGDTAGLYPFGLGRNQWPWAEDGNGAPWASTPGTWSDVAIFYQSLSAAQIQNLYVAGVGLWIQGTPDGSGNLILNWVPGGTLQQATSVTGPYTDVNGSPTPPYSVPISVQPHFYRVKR